MPNIFEIYVNRYKTYGGVLTDGIREVTSWADDHIGERNTNIVFSVTVIDRGIDGASRLIMPHPHAQAILRYAPLVKHLLKAGFAMIARGKSFSDALLDRSLSHSLDQLFTALDGDYSSLAPELRAYVKSAITETIRHGENQSQPSPSHR